LRRRAGESDPIAIGTEAVNDAPHESKHIAFMSSQVLNGEGYGVVIRCGDNTFIGKINALAAGTSGQMTTLQRDINMFVKFVAIVAITMAIVLFSAGLGRKMAFADAFVNGIVVVLVANIPQGLPATVTSALTLTAERMKGVSVLVKKTDIIESLGSATRIASDKTGTLTQNKMTVMNCWVNRQYKSASEIVAGGGRRTAASAGSAGRSTLSKSKQYSMRRTNTSMGNNTRISVGSTGRVPAYESNGHASVSQVDMDMPTPAASKGGGGAPPRTSSRFGTDIASRMSVGRASVGQAVRCLQLLRLLLNCPPCCFTGFTL
jgi:magnesium-transporting ATPase (P-type)